MSFHELGYLRFGRFTAPNHTSPLNDSLFHMEISHIDPNNFTKQGQIAWSLPAQVINTELTFGNNPPQMFTFDLSQSQLYWFEIQLISCDGSQRQYIGHSVISLGTIIQRCVVQVDGTIMIVPYNFQFSNGVTCEIAWEQNVYQDAKMVVQEIYAKNVKKMGFFSGKPETVLVILNHNNTEMYRSPIMWNDTNPRFPRVIHPVSFFTFDGGNGSISGVVGPNTAHSAVNPPQDPEINGTFTYQLWNFDEKAGKGKSKDKEQYKLIGERTISFQEFRHHGAGHECLVKNNNCVKLPLFAPNDTKEIDTYLEIGFRIVPQPSIATRLFQPALLLANKSEINRANKKNRFLFDLSFTFDALKPYSEYEREKIMSISRHFWRDYGDFVTYGIQNVDLFVVNAKLKKKLYPDIVFNPDGPDDDDDNHHNKKHAKHQSDGSWDQFGGLILPQSFPIGDTITLNNVNHIEKTYMRVTDLNDSLGTFPSTNTPKYDHLFAPFIPKILEGSKHKSNMNNGYGLHIIFTTAKPTKEIREQIDKGLMETCAVGRLASYQRHTFIFIGVGEYSQKWVKHYNHHRNGGECASLQIHPYRMTWALDGDSDTFQYELAKVIVEINLQTLIATVFDWDTITKMMK